MHTGMERSKDASAERAFQSLPRNLRRRAASHNIKRLPVRLRERAMREVRCAMKIIRWDRVGRLGGLPPELNREKTAPFCHL